MNFLIVGLGNVGADYEQTRHNIGFDVLDVLAEKKACDFKLERLAFKTDFRFKGHTFHLIKPTTYMNLSGKAVRYWMQTTKTPLENVLVIVDELDLPFGKLRLRTKGSAGSHNGLKNIEALLGTQKYARLRFGIGDDFPRGKQVQYVLGRWTEDELAGLHQPIETACDIIISYGAVGATRTMNTFNKKK